MGRNKQSSPSSSSIDSNATSYTFGAVDDHMIYGRVCHEGGDSVSSVNSCSSSTRSRHYVSRYNAKDLSSDLRLGLSISPAREHYSDWPPIKPFLRSTLAGKSNINRRDNTLFVKVYMEGIPIGRKLDLLAHDNYESLVNILGQMFKTSILCPENNVNHNALDKHYILTYEDKEGDWMMVGDVPWEMFLTTVKRLKIATLDSCQ